MLYVWSFMLLLTSWVPPPPTYQFTLAFHWLLYPHRWDSSKSHSGRGQTRNQRQMVVGAKHFQPDSIANMFTCVCVSQMVSIQTCMYGFLFSLCFIWKMCEWCMCEITDPGSIRGLCGSQRWPRCSQRSVQVYLRWQPNQQHMFGYTPQTSDMKWHGNDIIEGERMYGGSESAHMECAEIQFISKALVSSRFALGWRAERERTHRKTEKEHIC